MIVYYPNLANLVINLLKLTKSQELLYYLEQVMLEVY